MNSSATPCLYVLSQRTCEGHKGQIYTQLWAGYAAHLASKMGPKDEPKKIIIVDLGSGEFKRFVCRIQHGKAVEKLSETPDKETPKVYNRDLKAMLDALAKKYQKIEEAKNNYTNEQVDDTPANTYTALVKSIVDR